MGKRIVVALGGNALGNSPQEQLELVKGTAKPIVDLVEKGYDVIIGHGNGPQVGMINLAMEFSANQGGGTPYMPFPECGAMTQGYIGYHLQQAIQAELRARGIVAGFNYTFGAMGKGDAALIEAEAAKLDPGLIGRYKAIKQHCTPPMAKLINGQCRGCFMSLPSATLLKLKDGNELILCDNCGRIIYAEE